MANPIPSHTIADISRLQWQSQGEFQIATDGTCLYMREATGSRIAGFVFGIMIGSGSAAFGGWSMTQDGIGSKLFGVLMLVVALVFGLVIWSSIRRGPWMITYDRGSGEQGVSGEIRYYGGHLAADRVRCFTTRPSGGSVAMPRRIVAAELHDGTYEVLGPSGVSTWPAHWAKQVADWMALPHRDATD